MCGCLADGQYSGVSTPTAHRTALPLFHLPPTLARYQSIYLLFRKWIYIKYVLYIYML